jgi:subfamily B ATP-binding cassette protein MsbA
MNDLKKYLRILSYLKPYKRLVLLTILSSFLVAGSFAGAIGGVKPFADLLFGKFDVRTYEKLPFMNTGLGMMLLNRVQLLLSRDKFDVLLVFAAVILLLTCFRAVFKYTQGYTSAYLSNRMRMDIVIELHDKIMSQSLSFFTKQGVGNTISVLNNDAALIQRGSVIMLDKMILEPLNIVVALVIAFLLNARLAAIAAIGLPIFGYAVSRFGRQVKKNTRKSLRNTAAILSILQESLFGIKVIKSFVMEGYEHERFHSENKRLLKNTMRAVKARELIAPVVEVIAAFGIALFILLGGRDVLSGKMSLTGFLMFYGALGSVFGPLRTLSKAIGEIQASLAGAVRVFEFMDQLPAIKDPPGAVEMLPIKGAVVFDHVSFGYEGANKVIYDVDFEAQPGEIVALVGFSGAGKTTLINLLLRFYDVSEGSIRIDGVGIRSVKQASLRSQIGLVTQETVLFNDTVANNISFGRKDYSREEIVNAAKAANAHEFIEELPDGYDAGIGERGMLLSGGQRQRLAIARTILKNPAIFVLDEATSSLDSKSESLIQDALARLIKGRTTFVIAHRLSTIQNADKIVVLDKGRIEAVGPHASLYATSAIYRSLYDKQFLAPPEPVSVESAKS